MLHDLACGDPQDMHDSSRPDRGGDGWSVVVAGGTPVGSVTAVTVDESASPTTPCLTDGGGIFNMFVNHEGRAIAMTDTGLLERGEQHEIDLDRAFAALADPTRRAIVSRLAEGECTVNQLAAPFAISLPAISRHLKVLEQAGLISRGRDAQRRPCRLRLDALDEMGRYVVHTRAAWEQRLDRLERFLATDPAPHTRPHPHQKDSPS